MQARCKPTRLSCPQPRSSIPTPAGWTAFGGPAAHVAMFQKLFVDKLHWCTYMVFTELLMLGQCMPGEAR